MVVAALFSFVAFFANPSDALAWDNHALGTAIAVSAAPEVRDAAPVQAEALEAFLAAEARGLETVLEREEAWARANVPEYASRPEALRFQAAGEPATLKQRFAYAIRINPETKLALFLQQLPGAGSDTRPVLPRREVQLATSEKDQGEPYRALHEGEQVLVADVVATASDEPDYGMDIGLFEDNGTSFGARYGFGKQPFGNSKLSFGSQAPFHMGFFHESPIIYKAAGFLKRTYPEARIHLYLTLSRYAFATGHPYWGWRFAGWGSHYIQDLTQPYHARALPGLSTAYMLWINLLDVIGMHGPKNERVQLVSNRHLALENFQGGVLTRALDRGDMANPAVRALLREDLDRKLGTFTIDAVRSRISRDAAEAAKSTDQELKRSLPSRLVSDPEYIFGVTDPKVDVLAIMDSGAPESRHRMERLLENLIAPYGSHSRNFYRACATPERR